jgi:aryl-alcohol dehydrogenase-like predicted oxidoreductase
MSVKNVGVVRLQDLEVPRFGYGTMRLPGPNIWGPPVDHGEAIRVVRRAVELDTALAMTPIASVSNRYSTFERSDEPVLVRCEQEGIAYLPYFPLAAGNLPANHAVTSVARELGASVAQVALAWLLSRSPAILPIPGTSKVAHLEENVAATDLQLSEAQRALLDGEG